MWPIIKTDVYENEKSAARNLKIETIDKIAKFKTDKCYRMSRIPF